MFSLSDLEYVLTTLSIENAVRMLSFWDISSLIAAQRTSRILSAFVATYRQETWDIDEHFSEWFPDAVGFRQALGASKGIVGGSNILQFFDRSFYPLSDLNIFVPIAGFYTLGSWLNNVYTYQPPKGGHPIFEHAALHFSSNSDIITSGPVPTQTKHLPEELAIMSFGRIFSRDGRHTVMQKITMTVVSHNPIWYLLKQNTSTYLLL